MKKNTRESNMELLRVVAMFLVLAVHANFAALGNPTYEDAHVDTFVALSRYMAEALAIVCVNVFVLLSGWFGIRRSWSGFGKFVFQVSFFSIGMYLVSSIVGWTDFSLSGWIDSLFWISPFYWFVVSYLGLYILAPVLNAYIEHSTREQLGITLIAFYTFQTLYGCLAGGEESQFAYGYSVISFAGLYMLAQYVRRYPSKITTLPAWADAVLYIALAAIVAVLGFDGIYWNIHHMSSKVLAYNNPIVIAEAMALLLCFSKLRFTSKLVNWLGSGSFAVFLLHLHPGFYFEGFKYPIQHIAANNNHAATVLLVAAWLIGVFLLGVIVDQIRQFLWHRLFRHQ